MQKRPNVADYVGDRIDFMRTGQLEIRRDAPSLNLSRVARATQRIFEAAWDQSSERPLTVPVWRLLESMRHVQRQISERVNEVVRAIKVRLESRDRAIVHDWHIMR